MLKPPLVLSWQQKKADRAAAAPKGSRQRGMQNGVRLVLSEWRLVHSRGVSGWALTLPPDLRLLPFFCLYKRLLATRGA